MALKCESEEDYQRAIMLYRQSIIEQDSSKV